jgi:hypothetical protein
VDIHGHDVPITEQWDGTAPDWADIPESIEFDCIFYEVSDPHERAALEQAARDEAEAAWDLQHDEELERMRNWYQGQGVGGFYAWLEANGGDA